MRRTPWVRIAFRLLPWIPLLAGTYFILVAFFNGPTPLSVGQRLSNRPAGEIEGQFTVGQTFRSPYPGLYRIDGLLATYGRWNSGQVRFSLAEDSKRTTLIFTSTFEASEVGDNRVRSFEFASQNDSTGKTYFFYLESPNSVPGDAITAWTQSDNPYPDGTAYFGKDPVENDVTFVAYFQPSLWQVAGIYLDRMAAGRPGIRGSPVLLGGTFLLYFTLVGGLLAFLFRRATHHDR